MSHEYWNDMYAGWGWMLWFGMIFLIFSSLGNWGYTYQAHRRNREFESGSDAMDILAERYAKGEIQREEFHRMKEEIVAALNFTGSADKMRHGSNPLGAPIRGT